MSGLSPTEINLFTENNNNNNTIEQFENVKLNPTHCFNPLTISTYCAHEMNPELTTTPKATTTTTTTPLLMITSPNETVQFDEKSYHIDLSCDESYQRPSVRLADRKNQLTVNRECSLTDANDHTTTISIVVPSLNKNRRYSDQGSRLSEMNTTHDSSLSSMHKRQSLFNINSNTQHDHDLFYKTRLYPPTRFKNTSSSNVDLLAEAILKMQGTLNCK
ncbi:unnamed protein product [Schistosoma turkestanicum]|nr:unnamed protein product [Schistosoma turkestanicum]